MSLDARLTLELFDVTPRQPITPVFGRVVQYGVRIDDDLSALIDDDLSALIDHGVESANLRNVAHRVIAAEALAAAPSMKEWMWKHVGEWKSSGGS